MTDIPLPELAKELKDAGFPQGDARRNIPVHISVLAGDTDRNVYQPTLSELIEECGSPLILLSMTQGQWSCSSTTGKIHNADTPEVAVARLWLALNKK